LPCSISTAITVVQPLALAKEQVNKPTAPAPRTRIFDPGAIWARLNAWRTTERGSARAAEWRESDEGILRVSDPTNEGNGGGGWKERNKGGGNQSEMRGKGGLV
jgi:hypothetical protein